MQKLGRYTLYAQIASGGMATVHFARLTGEVGFARTVAVKRLHKNLAINPDFSAMFLDEARLAARIRHPNVVATLDIVSDAGEVFVVMDYVHGEPLSRLMRFVAGEIERIPFEIVSAIMTNVLAGLHAAHEVRDQKGRPLDLVHRDVSPQNIIVGTDGVARLIDFGVAKARGRAQESTQDGKVKGKLGYMSPEQLQGERIDRRTDIYAAGVVLWEMLTLIRLFSNKDDATTIENMFLHNVEPPSAFAADVPPAVDEVVMRALSRKPEDRFDTAKQMAAALEEAIPVATQAQVAEWVEQTASSALKNRTRMLSDIERATTVGMPWDWYEPSVIAPASGIMRARKRRAWGLGLAAAVAAISVGAAIRASVARPQPRAPTLPPSNSTIAVVDPVIPPAPSNTAPPPPTASTAHPAHRPLPPAKDPCDPPYTVGRDGVRHYKLNCIQ